MATIDTHDGEHVLFGALGSGSAAIEVALNWTGLPYRIVHAATWKPGRGLEALRSVNRLHQVPTLLLPGGQVLSESAAILIHLGLTQPASGLLPDDAARRAVVLRGLVYIAANCYAAIGVLDHPERWLPTSRQPGRDRLRAGARLRLHALWSNFADAFAADETEFFGGDQPDALDLLAATVSKWSGARSHLRAERPALFARLKRIDQHPRVAPVFARHWP